MRWRQLLIATAAALAPLSALAQAAYPSKPITWVVGFPPGGGADGVTRLVAAKMSQNIGQPVLVENRPGASSIIAAQHVAQQPADGYTILSAEQGGLVFNTALYSKLPYDAVKDFAPIIFVVATPYVLSVHPSLPAKSVKELIALAKARPG